MLDNPISRPLPLCARRLKRLSRCADIVVIDGGSNDATRRIAHRSALGSSTSTRRGALQLLGRVHAASTPQDDPRQRQPEIGLAKAVLDWEPTINLETGPNTTIDYFRRLLKHISG